MDFKQIPKNSRPLHFWAWNDKLNTDFTAEHIDLINGCGFGGFCISAQSGLMSRYMGGEWFRNISTAITKAAENNLEVWICDENGSPSGTGNGVVNSAGIEFQQKFLRCEPGEKSNDRTIICKDGYHFYYDTNPYYTDMLNKDAVKLFIEEAYAPYIESFPEGITGFISVAPALPCDCFPWSFTLPALYKDEYGEELLDVLTELFRPVGNYKETRTKFWSLITRLFSDNFFRQINDWCKLNNVKYSVIPASEDKSDFTMAHFPYMDFPSINIKSTDSINATPSLTASTTANHFEGFGGNAILLTESGNSTTFEDLKRVALTEFARGVTRISLGYESYTFNGIRKRTNSTYSFISQKSREDFSKFNNYISVIGNALSMGEADFDTVLIDNTSVLHLSCDDNMNDDADNLCAALDEAILVLEKKHIPFHIIDEITLRDFAKADNGILCIGKHRYKNIVLADSSHFLESTTALLSELEHGGAFITVPDALTPDSVCYNENLLYTKRRCEEFNIHYFFNNSDEEFTVELKAGAKTLDPLTGEILPFYGVNRFLPYDCLILIEDDTPELSRPFKKPLKTLDLSGDWIVEGSSENIIVLDKCDVYLNGNLAYENENAADVTDLICSINEPTEIECRFSLNVSTIPETIFLALESFQNFSLSINGSHIEEVLHRTDISQYINEGQNSISLFASFAPSEDFLNAYTKASESDSELNRLTYSLEFEPIYISGDFSVKTDGSFYKLDKNAYRYAGNFSVDVKKDTCSLSSLDRQGFPFFAGYITFKKIINLSDTQYCIKFIPKGIKGISVEINGQKVEPLLWAPFEFDASELLSKGDNEIKITIRTPLRNLFGPHHIPMGELTTVRPRDFYKHKCVWNRNNESPWDDNYCFIDFGIDLPE